MTSSVHRAALAIVLASIVFAAADFDRVAASQNKPRLDAGDPTLVTLGRIIYGEQCAACHGAKLEGQANWRTRRPDGRFPAPPHDQNGHTWHHDDGLLFDLTKLGFGALVGRAYETDMPIFAEILSDQEIIAVLSYIKSRWPKEVRDRHDEMNRYAR